jgi:hypothetical protein
LDQYKIVEKLIYDQNQKLITLRVYNYDSSVGAPILDSAALSFSAWGSNAPPASYDITNYTVGITEHHWMAYDNLGRAVIDSVTPNSSNDLGTIHCFYDNNGNNTLQFYYPDPNAPTGYSLQAIDTISVQAGNIAASKGYSVINGTDTLGNYGVLSIYKGEQDAYTYSTYTNPLYQSYFSNSLGSLFYYNSIGDYLSQKLPSHWIVAGNNGSPAFTINYSWTTNSAGKVVRGIGVESGSGAIAEEYTFTYN